MKKFRQNLMWIPIIGILYALLFALTNEAGFEQPIEVTEAGFFFLVAMQASSVLALLLIFVL